MKNNNLIIIFCLVFAGVFAQQGVSVSQIERTILVEESQYLSSVTVSQSYDLVYPLEEYEEMIRRCTELTAILKEHDDIIQKGPMSKSQINAWKRDLTEAKLLNYKINDYTSMYVKSKYPLIKYVNKEVLNNYGAFSKILKSAIQYAGI